MTESALVAELLQEGIAAAKAGQKETARKRLLQAIELDERNEQAWLWLSGVVESTEDRRVCLENVLAIDPNNSHAQSGLAWIQQNAPASAPSAAEDRCPRCRAEVSSSTTSCPECGLPLIVACPACGQYADVEQTSCPACGHHLGDFRQGVGYHLALAQAYLAKRQLDRAQEAIDRAEAESPNDPQVLAVAADLYEQSGRPDLAVAAYQAAIEQDPDNPALYTRLGALYRQRAQPEDARAMYQKAAELAGGDPASILELARISLQEKGAAGSASAESAIGLLNQVLEQQPMNAEANLLLGDAYLKKQHQQQAFQYYEHACKLAPPDSDLGRQARSKLAQLQTPPRGKAQPGQRRATRTGYSGRRNRPGCITLYVIIIGFFSATSLLCSLPSIISLTANRSQFEEALLMQQQLMAAEGFPADLGLLGQLLTMDAQAYMTVVWLSTAFNLAVSVLSLAVVMGLWRLKNWARMGAIAIHALSLLLSLAQSAVLIPFLSQMAALSGSKAALAPPLCMFTLLFAVNGYVIFWFVANREIFN